MVRLWGIGTGHERIAKACGITPAEVLEILATAELRARTNEFVLQHGMEWVVCGTCGQEYRRRKYLTKPKQCSVCRDAARSLTPSPDQLRRLLKWNLTQEQYDFRFKQQGGVCAICKNPEPQLNKALAVDHDHKTGQIRSLLCSKCNLGLGHFKDSPELLQSAIQYLNFHRKDADSLVQSISEAAVAPLSDLVS